MKNLTLLGRLTILFALLGSLSPMALGQTGAKPDWIALFNGEDIDDWQVKFRGQELGVNFRNTFRVEDGILKVSYDEWDDFNNEFGHLFYKDSFSHYLLRVEYRFAGDQVTNGPGWAFRNNGMMLHSQDPASMTVDQEFPASIEVQLLGGNGSDPRPTANVCTPGMHYVRAGQLIRRHCTNSTSKTFHGDQWVSLEVEIRGDQSIVHRVNGEEVFNYGKPQLDDQDRDAQALLAAGAPIAVTEGFIAIQAESHPTEFRRIELLPLD